MKWIGVWPEPLDTSLHTLFDSSNDELFSTFIIEEKHIVSALIQTLSIGLKELNELVRGQRQVMNSSSKRGEDVNNCSWLHQLPHGNLCLTCRTGLVLEPPVRIGIEEIVRTSHRLTTITGRNRHILDALHILG